MTYNPISQNNDDHFYIARCSFVRGEPNEIVPGTVIVERGKQPKCKNGEQTTAPRLV